MLHTMRHIQTSHISTEEIKTAIQTKYKHGGKVC